MALPFVLPLDNPLFIPAVSVLLLLLVYALYKSLFASASKQRRTILLLGNLESGKTAILSTLIYNQTPPTHTSLQPNSSVLPIPLPVQATPPPKSKRPAGYTLLDIPGHPRLRASYVSHLHLTHTILFVVDTSTIARSMGPGAASLVAEYLHNVLYQLSLIAEDPKASKKGGVPKLVIVAHKVDLVNTGGTVLASTSGGKQPASKGEIGLTRVRTILERELTRRANDLKRTVGIEGLGSDSSSSPRSHGGNVKSQTDAADAGMVIDASSGHTGLECTGGGEGFKFDAWEYGEIEFVSSWVNVRGGEFDYSAASASADEGDSEKEEMKKAQEKSAVDEEDGLKELKEWLNDHLAA